MALLIHKQTIKLFPKRTPKEVGNLLWLKTTCYYFRPNINTNLGMFGVVTLDLAKAFIKFLLSNRSVKIEHTNSHKAISISGAVSWSF